MNPPTSIPLWEQRFDGPPVCHAVTNDLDLLPGIIRAWASQFCRQPVVAQHAGDGVLVIDVSGKLPRPIAMLWAEYPDHLLAEMIPARLDARWRGPALGEAWDVRGDVDVKRRVGR
jgi:hypothetical protein